MRAPQEPHTARRHVAVLMADLNGGGVQRMSLTVADHLARRGHRVSLLICKPGGELSGALPNNVESVRLQIASDAVGRWTALRADPLGLPRLLLPILLARRASPTLPYLPAMADWLARQRPHALIAATPNNNIEAVLARRLAGVPTRLVLTERTAISDKLASSTRWRHRHLTPLMRRCYLQADVVAAVSRSLGDDIARETGIPRPRIVTLYNPVVGPELEARSHEPVDHPFFRNGGPPVVLAAGRLAEMKDFPTLIRAFARLVADRPARLIILGRAAEDETTRRRQAELMELAGSLDVAEAVDLPGFVHNPYAWMRRASLFVLSSRREGLPGVLIQAMACGCPVVSTDCPTGPREVLEDGRLGPLVPVGDDAAMASAMRAQLDDPTSADELRERAAQFSVESSIDAYERLLA